MLQVQRLGMSGYSTTASLEKILATVFISHDSDWMSENHARAGMTRVEHSEFQRRAVANT